jgi:hypothetical protein
MNTALIDSLTKCRISLDFEYNCISISTILMALGMTGIVLIVLSYLIKYQSKNNELCKTKK